MGLMLKENKLNVNSYFYGQVKRLIDKTVCKSQVQALPGVPIESNQKRKKGNFLFCPHSNFDFTITKESRARPMQVYIG